MSPEYDVGQRSQGIRQAGVLLMTDQDEAPPGQRPCTHGDELQIDALLDDPVRFLVLSFDTDWRFSTEHSRRIVRHLEGARLPTSFREIHSAWGHDSFLLDIPDYHATVRAFLERAAEDLS